MKSLRLRVNPKMKLFLNYPNKYLQAEVSRIWHSIEDKKEASETIFTYLAVILASDKEGQVTIDESSDNINEFMKAHYDYLDERARYLIGLAEMN